MTNPVMPPEPFALSRFDFSLPPELIASQPLADRAASRMLVVDPGSLQIADMRVRDLPGLLSPGDVLVRNNSRVLKARLHAKKRSGGAAELLIERICNEQLAIAQIGVSKKPKPGDELLLADGTAIQVLARDGMFWQLRAATSWHRILESLGELPLPHYMQRAADATDETRYQTIYAKSDGSVAAPTAGLHFDEALLAAIAARGVSQTELTLHVGAGTFQPIRSADVRAHEMHQESISIPASAQRAVLAAKAAGHKVCAVGTTSLRSLESWAKQIAQSGSTTAGFDAKSINADFVSETALYIYPGFDFQLTNCLLTNFHLPKSSLFLLVSAFAGVELMQQAYQHAIQQRYRFYSYGDAMLIAPGVLR